MTSRSKFAITHNCKLPSESVNNSTLGHLPKAEYVNFVYYQLVHCLELRTCVRTINWYIALSYVLVYVLSTGALP